VFHPISVSPYLVPLPPGDDPIAVTVIIIIIIIILRHSKMFFVLKFELILIIGSNKALTEGARKVYRGRGAVLEQI
jgi:hypothetical protein